MTRTTLAINELKKNNLPYLVILTDPTAGGSLASFSMLGDIHFAEPGAIVAFSGARVIKATVKEELPEGFQKSEYVKKTGSIELKEKLNESIGIVEKFRKNHMKITAQYILEQADNEEDISGTGGTEFVTFLSRTRADTCESKIP